MNLNKWFDQGISKEDYANTLTNHAEAFNHIYENFSFPVEDQAFLESLKNKKIRILVIAQEFCGHCMLNVPILYRISEAINSPISLMIRDDHLDLMDHYLTNGKQIIPIAIFIDQAGNELAKWGPAAPEINAFTNELKDEMPDKEAANYDEKFKALIQKVGSSFKNDARYWNYAYADMRRVLMSI